MKFDPTTIQDQYGRSIYYQVDENKTTSKILALELAKGDLNKISFHWNEQELDQIPWSTEPTQTFDQLMDKTVINLRINYKKVNLFYSGGYDSHTIYEAFRRNNIVIDKFIIWRREWYHGLSDDEYNSGLEAATWIKNHIWPNLEIVTLAWRINDNHQWYREMKNDWIYHNGSVLKFSKHSRDMIYTYNSDVMDQVLSDSNSVTIIGHEKPKLDLYNNKWYVSHLDTAYYTDFHDPCLQLYYIPEIYHQQAWQIIKWMELIPGFSHEMLHQIQSNSLGPDMYENYSVGMGRAPVFHHINATGGGKRMWKHKDPRLVPESADFLTDTRLHAPDVYNYYNTGLEYVEQKFGHLMGNGNLPGLFSKKYFVKDFEDRSNNGK